MQVGKDQTPLWMAGVLKDGKSAKQADGATPSKSTKHAARKIIVGSPHLPQPPFDAGTYHLDDIDDAVPALSFEERKERIPQDVWVQIEALPSDHFKVFFFIFHQHSSS